jgi:hypothetical protein
VRVKMAEVNSWCYRRSPSHPARADVDPNLPQVHLRSGDTISGHFRQETIELACADGNIRIPLADLRLLTRQDPDSKEFVAWAWGRPAKRGKPLTEHLVIELAPGAEASVSFSAISGVTVASPPAKLTERVNALIAKLGADTFSEREAASQELASMGEEIRTLLERALDNPDSEVRARIDELLKR